MQMVNNATTVSYAENYTITAAKAGVMHLPAVPVVVDGQTYTTDPVDVTISRPGSTDQMTLEFSLSDKQCFVGQPLVMTVKWAILGRTRAVCSTFRSSSRATSTLKTYRSRSTPNPSSRFPFRASRSRSSGAANSFGGKEADGLSFSKVLIPKKAGHLRLNPITASANLAVGREQTGDFYNPYRLKFQRVSVQSNPIELDVRPLPETGQPPQFYGLVGQYTITASATPTKVNVGDPITLTIRIGGNPLSQARPVAHPGSGAGTGGQFQDPGGEGVADVEGPCKVFTQTLRANSDKVTQIPALPLAYFDAARGAYVVAKTEPIKLDVAPSKVLTNVDVQGTAASAPVNREVEAIRKGLSANYYGPEALKNQSFSILSMLANPVYGTLWSIPLLALLVSSVVKLAGRTNPESLARKRRHQAAGAALTQLKKVSSAAAGQQHELLLAAMKGYIGDRFDKVAASLTADDCSRAIVDATGDTGGGQVQRVDRHLRDRPLCPAPGEDRLGPGAGSRRVDPVGREGVRPGR